ncbi:roadblock/LC7 domain-containing protein [Streptomyces coeruleorubidus]|uniref:roadblock/LC7 domain-containing protein n=1 Tax=Streptomyces coeruleorubidus TaxID=116188 RepID=UPI0033C5D131
MIGPDAGAGLYPQEHMLMTHDTPHPDSDTMTAASGKDAKLQLAGLLKNFVDNVPRVTHALLISRDGLSLVDSEIHKDWADKWAATLGSLASLSENIPGPGGGRAALRLALIERGDALIFVSIAGTSAAFPNQPGNTAGMVDTVLAVIAEPAADAGTVGFEMGQLVDRFAPYMVAPVRSA